MRYDTPERYIVGGARIVMAVAKQLGDLLRLVVSSVGEDGTLYLCGTCVVLERLSRERGGETASEELIAGLLEQLHLALAKCRHPTCDEREPERGGRGVGEGPEWWEKRAGERWESVWQLCRETVRDVGEERRQTLLSLVCECRHFAVVCCQLLATALAAGRSCGCWLNGRESRFLLERFWSAHIDRFADRVDPISDGTRGDDVHTIWCRCLEHLVLLVTIHEVSQENQDTTAPTSHTEQFLCQNTSNKLAIKLSRTFPQVLHAVYQQWWNSDKDTLQNSPEIPTINKDGTGLILKVGLSISNLCTCDALKSLKSTKRDFLNGQSVPTRLEGRINSNMFFYHAAEQLLRNTQ